MRIKMHSLEEVGTSVPAFLAKLWKLVEDPETNDLIHWSAEGASFVIQNTARFSRELLPLYYKHNNMASFIRQLNMYGFHKVVSLESGGLKIDKDEMEFAHPCFVVGHPYLLENIKRKIPNKVEGELRPGARTDVYGKVLSEVKSMKGRQESLDSQLVAMKRENEVLWREVALLREKHKQQQTIVNKLVHFFVNLFQADEAGNLRLKRHARLMIKDKAHSAAKVAKLDPDLIHSYFDQEDRSPEGPVIHEIDASDLLNGYSSTVETSGDEAQLLPQDLCKAVERRESRTTSGPTQQDDDQGGDPGDILLDVCPDIMVTSAPLDIDDVIAEATDTAPIRAPPSAPIRAPPSAPGRAKRRRRRRSGTSARPTPTCLTSQNDNGLTIILPLEEMVDDPQTVEMIVPEMHDPHDKQEERERLEAATDAAIRAISTVAAASSSAPEKEERAPPAGVPDATTPLDREHLDSHVGAVQSELDSLREILKGEGYNLDDSTLLGVRPAHHGLPADVFAKIFSSDPLSYELSELPGDSDLADDGEKKQEFSSDPMITGTELISPSSNGLPELTDFLDWSQASDAPGDYELMLGELGAPQLVPGSPPGVAK